jgi:hypothetical protein
MPSEENPQPGVSSSTLARQNVGLFAEPEIRETIRGATGLSGEGLDRVAEGLARLGVALILPNGADRQAKFALVTGPPLCAVRPVSLTDDPAGRGGSPRIRWKRRGMTTLLSG